MVKETLNNAQTYQCQEKGKAVHLSSQMMNVFSLVIQNDHLNSTALIIIKSSDDIQYLFLLCLSLEDLMDVMVKKKTKTRSIE